MTTAGRVIVGVHGSLASLAALRFAVTHARRAGATLHAVLAWAPPEGLTGARQGRGSSALTEIWTNQASHRLQEAFDQAFGGIPTDIDLHTYLIRGRPGPVLTALADHPDDLLVIGSSHRRFHSPVRRHCTTRNQSTLILAPLTPLAHSAAARRKRPYSGKPFRGLHTETVRRQLGGRLIQQREAPPCAARLGNTEAATSVSFDNRHDR